MHSGVVIVEETTRFDVADGPIVDVHAIWCPLNRCSLCHVIHAARHFTSASEATSTVLTRSGQVYRSLTSNFSYLILAPVWLVRSRRDKVAPDLLAHVT